MIPIRLPHAFPCVSYIIPPLISPSCPRFRRAIFHALSFFSQASRSGRQRQTPIGRASAFIVYHTATIFASERCARVFPRQKTEGSDFLKSLPSVSFVFARSVLSHRRRNEFVIERSDRFIGLSASRRIVADRAEATAKQRARSRDTDKQCRQQHFFEKSFFHLPQIIPNFIGFLLL